MLPDLLAVLATFGLGTVLNLLAAMLPSTREKRDNLARLAAGSLTIASLCLPFVLAIHATPILRSLMAQGLAVESWRVAEILRTPPAFSRRERALRVVLLPYEHTFLERTSARWPLRDLALSSLLLAAGVAGLVLTLSLTTPLTPYRPAGWPRWLGATASGYVTMEGMTWQWVSLLVPFGWRHRPYQRHPILSRTIAEFWGVRWSSVVHAWLRTNVYGPLARRGAPRAGIVAAFGVSALLHAYIVWPAAGLVPALWMLAFFVAHGVFMVIEAKLRVRLWPVPARRAFVVAVFALTVPLFMEPILRALGGGVAP
jgi:hypothetical protein